MVISGELAVQSVQPVSTDHAHLRVHITAASQQLDQSFCLPYLIRRWAIACGIKR